MANYSEIEAARAELNALASLHNLDFQHKDVQAASSASMPSSLQNRNGSERGPI
jgi:hypothetical protein